MVSWSPPPKGWCKLNVDGTCSGNGEAGCGGVIRGDCGEWLSGFSAKLSTHEPIAAETRAIKEGLEICWEMGFRHIIVESDAKLVVDALNDNGILMQCRETVKSIQRLLRRKWQVKMQHVYREGNRCADQMTALSKGMEQERMIWKTPPREAMSILQEDSDGVSFPREIVS